MQRPQPASQSQNSFPWCNPQHFTANQQGSITQEQRLMLRRPDEFAFLPAGCLGIITFLTIVPALLLANALHNQSVAFFPLILLGFTTVALCYPYIRATNLLHAAESGQIAVEQGEVIWQKGRYIVRTPGRQLKTAIAALDLPPPGPYHFYYLIGSNILLSARPIHNFTNALNHPDLMAATGLSGREQAYMALQQALHDALGFSLHDLDFNRNGQLSPDQYRRLSAQLFKSTIGYMLAIPIGLGLIAGPFVYEFVNNSSNAMTVLFSHGAACLSLIGVAPFLGGLHALAIGIPAKRASLNQARVSVLKDIVRSRHIEHSEAADEYYFDVGGMTFSVNSAAYDALVANQRYCVYYLPSMDAILSIEPMELAVH